MIGSEDAVHTMAAELAIKHPPNNREYVSSRLALISMILMLLIFTTARAVPP